MKADRHGKLLFEEPDWTFETLARTYEAVKEVACSDLGLDVYPNQLEIISSEQMLDSYSSIGMPLMYRHWSFGKHFVREEQLYRKGARGLAYELVINSNPCISYNMAENSMPLQALVMAHAAFGHNHFFKNNYLFREWTDAEYVLDYLAFAKGYIAKCEEKYGLAEVEAVLDAAHALMSHGVFRYKRLPSLRTEEERELARREEDRKMYREIWNTLPASGNERELSEEEQDLKERKRKLKLPEENLLYFVEKYSPSLETWQREVVRIVRNISQYFYPQKQTKLMNEGFATFVHHYIVSKLADEGKISHGAMLEILHNHSNVIFQPDFDDPRYAGINPYALGFAMMEDIRRLAEEPTEEDREWFSGNVFRHGEDPDPEKGKKFVGCGDWRIALKYAAENFRDESFIKQYLSPALMRKLRLFALVDDANESHYLISDIHDERGYKNVRKVLARMYNLGRIEPNIQVVDVDLSRDRVLYLEHGAVDGVPLNERLAEETLKHLRSLWGYDVVLRSFDGETNEDFDIYETHVADDGADKTGSKKKKKKKGGQKKK